MKYKDLKMTTKLKNRLALLLTFFAICILVPIKVKAGTEGLVEPWTYADGSLYPVIDTADLLTEEEEDNLAAKIEEISGKHQSAIVILTVNSLGDRSVSGYADDFYDYNGFGYGENHDGIIFIISMETREWFFDTTGSARKAYDDEELQSIFDSLSSDLSEGNYYSAFNTFVSKCDYYLQDYYDESHFSTGNLLVCLAVGLGLSILTLLFFIGQLKTVHPAKGAAGYSQKGLNLTVRNDRFLHHHITKTKIQKDSDGGSSSHTGSSGTSHGGIGGHF